MKVAKHCTHVRMFVTGPRCLLNWASMAVSSNSHASGRRSAISTNSKLVIFFTSLGGNGAIPSPSKWSTTAGDATAAGTAVAPVAPEGFTATKPCDAVAAAAVVGTTVAELGVIAATPADSDAGHSAEEGMTVASTVRGTAAVMAGSVGMVAGITPIATATETQGGLGGARNTRPAGIPLSPPFRACACAPLAEFGKPADGLRSVRAPLYLERARPAPTHAHARAF